MQVHKPKYTETKLKIQRSDNFSCLFLCGVRLVGHLVLDAILCASEADATDIFVDLEHLVDEGLV